MVFIVQLPLSLQHCTVQSVYRLPRSLRPATAISDVARACRSKKSPIVDCKLAETLVPTVAKQKVSTFDSSAQLAFLSRNMVCSFDFLVAEQFLSWMGTTNMLQ